MRHEFSVDFAPDLNPFTVPEPFLPGKTDLEIPDGKS